MGTSFRSTDKFRIIIATKSPNPGSHLKVINNPPVRLPNKTDPIKSTKVKKRLSSKDSKILVSKLLKLHASSFGKITKVLLTDSLLTKILFITVQSTMFLWLLSSKSFQSTSNKFKNWSAKFSIGTVKSVCQWTSKWTSLTYLTGGMNWGSSRNSSGKLHTKSIKKYHLQKWINCLFCPN
jgi:hypothetical protein